MRRLAPLPTILLGTLFAAALTVAPAPAFAKGGKGPHHHNERYEQQGRDDDRGLSEHRGYDDRGRSEQRGNVEGRERGNGIEKWWRELPEAEQQRHMHDYDRYRQLDPNRRDHVRDRWQRFRNLPPEQQDKLRRQYKRWKELPAGEQEQLQRTWSRYRELPRQQQQQLKEELRALRQLPDAERERRRQELHRSYFPDLPPPSPRRRD
jgi:Protein of unknown function (DUF3106)